MIRPTSSSESPRVDADDVAMPPPSSIEEAGLPQSLVIDLILKHLLRGGELSIAELGARIALPLPMLDRLLAFIRGERLVEVPRRGNFDADVRFVLTDAGHLRSDEAMRRNQYAGPAPVSLKEYVDRVQRQKVLDSPVSRARLESVLGDLVLPQGLTRTLGAALNSHRPIFLYGPSGSGKTFLAEHLLGAIEGQVWVPHAVSVDGEIIQVFDPLVHRRVESVAHAGVLDRAKQPDARWVRCRRPVVTLAGELTLEMMDPGLDPVTRFYKAPVQLKANNGMLLLDDLGRQRSEPYQILNRWIVPLDRRIDYLKLHTGASFQVPFDVMVIFSSNLSPAALDDPAFVRRIGYKVRMDAVEPAAYRRIFEGACVTAGLKFDDSAADYLIDVLHGQSGMPLMPAYPLDLVLKVRDRATYDAVAPQLTPESLRWAWNLYFAAERPEDRFESTAAHTGALFKEEGK
jgi:predicted ATPase with chaperone activity